MLLDVEGATTYRDLSVHVVLSSLPIQIRFFECFAAIFSGRVRTATPAKRVRLVVALSEAGSSLRCLTVSLDARRCVMARGPSYSLWFRNCAQTLSVSGQNFKNEGSLPCDAEVVSVDSVKLDVRDRNSRHRQALGV